MISMRDRTILISENIIGKFVNVFIHLGPKTLRKEPDWTFSHDVYIKLNQHFADQKANRGLPWGLDSSTSQPHLSVRPAVFPSLLLEKTMAKARAIFMRQPCYSTIYWHRAAACVHHGCLAPSLASVVPSLCHCVFPWQGAIGLVIVAITTTAISDLCQFCAPLYLGGCVESASYHRNKAPDKNRADDQRFTLAPVLRGVNLSSLGSVDSGPWCCGTDRRLRGG